VLPDLRAERGPFHPGIQDHLLAVDDLESLELLAGIVMSLVPGPAEESGERSSLKAEGMFTGFVQFRAPPVIKSTSAPLLSLAGITNQPDCAKGCANMSQRWSTPAMNVHWTSQSGIPIDRSMVVAFQ
jgi:hypothetical protein